MADQPVYKKDWILTGPALEKLLHCLGAAGVDYLELRRRLEKFFEYNRVPDPDELIDITFDRAARRIEEGEEVLKPVSYITTIARFVLKEYWNRTPTDSIDEEDRLADRTIDRRALEEEEKLKQEARFECLAGCAQELTPVERQRLIDYYYEEKRAKIDKRKEIAELLGITRGNLSVRMFRTRERLFKCMARCMGENLVETK